MKLYVGTYHKYSSGSICGDWLDLDDFSNEEEFIVACNEIHSDEEAPELMFQCFEADFGWERLLYSESAVPSDYWEIKKELQEQCVDENVFSSFASLCSEPPSVDMVEKCQEAYQGDFESIEEYARKFCEETGLLQSVPNELRLYIDFEKMASVWKCSREIDFVDGYVFLML